MEVSFGDIYLFSSNPEKLFHFLSFLFDIEPLHYKEHEIEFVFNRQKMIIKQNPKKRVIKDILFSLKVTDLEELIDLRKNIIFYYFKEKNKKFHNELNDEILEFNDPDGRLWRVEVDDHQMMPLAKVSLTPGNVRNF